MRKIYLSIISLFILSNIFYGQSGTTDPATGINSTYATLNGTKNGTSFTNGIKFDYCTKAQWDDFGVYNQEVNE